ncbi:MAG: Gfo/Idh/MocA family oxidoreductase [Ignavibacteriae bacterium]|nr:Gfo/Idh/MocA family oxidoreductase [Ignavibacteriota bacterium]
MNSKIKWGILSTAYIGTEHVIPAMMNSEYSDVIAISSRDYEKSKIVANKLNIPKYYGTYEELLKDNEIEAVYIPLPNHLHVPWAIKCLEAGKHALLEKPIGVSSLEAQKLLDESKKYPHLKIMEAFMYRHHPQWINAKKLVDSGAIGKVKTIQSFFSFFDDNPKSIVNTKEYGGGSLMDIGCYPISLSRFIFNSEPQEVFSSIEYHPKFEVDIDATVLMKFNEGTSSFFSSIQLEERQQAQIFGTEGKLEFLIPFNPIANEPSKIFLHRNNKTEEIVFEPCDQYTIQADLFSLAIINNSEVPTSLKDAVNNMKVIEKIVESDKLGKPIEL